MSQQAADRLLESWWRPLLVGTMVWGCLWVAGLPELGWVGYAMVAVAWGSLPGAPAGEARPAAPRMRSATGPVQVQSLGDGTYTLDPLLSDVAFVVRKLGIPVTGTFGPLTGELVVTGAAESSRIDCEVPAGSFRTANMTRDRHVVGPAFLDADRFPRLRFTGIHVPDGHYVGGALVSGTMTVRGISAPVTFTVDSVSWSDDSGHAEVIATSVVRRSSFGVTGYRWLISDAVDVRVRAVVRPPR